MSSHSGYLYQVNSIRRSKRDGRAQERAKASYPGKTFKLPVESSVCGSVDGNWKLYGGLVGVSGRKCNCVWERVYITANYSEST
jgi:hypothetical protein